MPRGFPDYELQKSGLYTRSAWAALEGDEKILSASLVNRTWNQSTQADYIVPAGKELTMVFVAGTGTANLQAGADAPHNFDILVLKNLTSQLNIAGDTGKEVTLDQPLVFAAADDIDLIVRCKANHALDLGVYAFCYERDV